MVKEEDEFVYISDEDIESGKEDFRKNCFGKLYYSREVSLVGLWNCLQRCLEIWILKSRKLGQMCFSFISLIVNWCYISIVEGGLWNFEDHLLGLSIWDEREARLIQMRFSVKLNFGFKYETYQNISIQNKWVRVCWIVYLVALLFSLKSFHWQEEISFDVMSLLSGNR